MSYQDRIQSCLFVFEKKRFVSLAQGLKHCGLFAHARLRDCNVSYDATFSASLAAAAAVPMLTRELVTRIKKRGSKVKDIKLKEKLDPSCCLFMASHHPSN